MSDKSNILASLLGGMGRPSSRLAPTAADSATSQRESRPESGGRATSGGKQHKLRQRFNVIRKLGKGAYGKVQLAINKETGQEVAIKTIKKTKIENELDMERVRREIQIMSSIEHPHIVHIYEVFENKDKIVLVMQYAPGGELYEYVSDAKVLDEAEARRLFRQIATAIYYCHQNKICHRDLKLENILLDEKNNAKLADFGLSNVFDKRRQLKTFCGSPLYASPEIVQGSPYEGPEVDCWSLGVLLYTLVYGAMPFDGSNFKRLVKQISESCYFEPKQKSHASPLIRRLLCADPNKRATIVDICSDPWVNGMVGLEQPHNSLLQVAQDMANLTPVRMDILMALALEALPEEQQQQARNDTNTAEKPPLGPIENIPAKPKTPLEQESTLPIATFVLRDLEPVHGQKEDKENGGPPPDDLHDTQQHNEAEQTTSAPGNPVGEELEKEERKMEVLECENHLIDEVPAALQDAKQDNNELEEIPMELDTVVYQKLGSPVAVTVESLQAEQNEEPVEVSAVVNETEEKEPSKAAEVVEKVEEDKNNADRTSEEKVSADAKVINDDKQAEDKVEDKPKKAKKKVLVKRKKKVSKKEKEGEEPKVAAPLPPVPSDGSAVKPGRIQIPDTFIASPDPSATEAPPPRPVEGRRQSALIADVAQKLFQPASQQSPKHDDDLHELANVRVSDKKSEFERRASSSSGTPSYSPAAAAEHRRRSSVSRQPEPQPSKAVLLREPSSEFQTGLVEMAPVRVAFTAKELASSKPPEPTNLQVPHMAVLNDSQETIKPDTPESPVQVRSQLSIKLGGGPTNNDTPQQTATRQPTPTLVPIARSYKKVTFTKDGACVTETGRVISTELPDGTIRRVDRRSKVTHYINSDQQQHPGLHNSSEFNTVTSSTSSEVGGGQLVEDPDWDPFSRLVMPSTHLQLHHTDNRHKVRANESCSSLSSGSTDAFEDIFDTWTGAFHQHGFPAALHGSRLARHARHGLSGSGHRSEAASPRCESADPKRSCKGGPLRPPVWPSSAGSGYESDAAGSRVTRVGHRFGGSLIDGGELSLRSSGTNLLLGSRVEDLHSSIAEEHERLRQRIAKQHKNFWKGSTPSLFSVGADRDPIQRPETTASSVRMSPANRPPRPSSSVQQKQVIRTTSVKTKSPISHQQEQVEQSLSSTSFIQQSVALDPAPRRQPPLKAAPLASDSFTSLIKSCSRTSVQSRGTSFIGLKKSTSIKQKLEQQEVQLQQQHPMNQQDETARVQNWLQNSTGPTSTLSSGSSGSSFGVSTNNSATQATVCPPTAESTKTSGSMSSVSHGESSTRLHRTFHHKTSTIELPAELSSPLESQTSHKSPLKWIHSSLLEENEEAETDEFNISDAPLRAGSLLNQLRSRGYRSMINQRMELQEEPAAAGSQHLIAATTKTTTSSSTTSFVNESGAITTQQQQHFVTTTSSSSSSSTTGQQKTPAASGSHQAHKEETAVESSPMDANVSKQQEAAAPADQLAPSCPAPIQNNILDGCSGTTNQPEAGQHVALNEQVVSDVGQVEVERAERTAVVVEKEVRDADHVDADDDDDDDDDDDEDLRQGKEAVKAQLQRMRETELFLKSLQKDEEQEQVRKQSFLFDNMILNARLSSELARASALSNSKSNLWSAGSSSINVDFDQTDSLSPKQQQQQQQLAAYHTTSNSTLPFTAPLSAPVLLQELHSSPFMSSFVATPSSTHTAPILTQNRRPLRTSLGNRPLASDQSFLQHLSGQPALGPTSSAIIPEYRRSRSQLGGAEFSYPASRPSRAAFPELDAEPTSTYSDTSFQHRPRYRSQSQVRQVPGSLMASTAGQHSGSHRWRRELSVNPSYRATSPLVRPATTTTSHCGTTAGTPERCNSDEDTLHQDDVERFGLAKFRVSAYAPPSRPTRPADRRRSLQVSQPSTFARSADSVEPDERAGASETVAPEVGRRYSTVSECGEKTGQSRLQELEERILANKKRRDELLGGSLCLEPAQRLASSDRLEAHRGASPGRPTSPLALAATTTLGGGSKFGARGRASSRLSGAPEQPITSSSSSSRPSRLESMEARIKRRSYCVRLGDCSPERASLRPASLTLEGWKRGPPMQGTSTPSPQSQTAAPDRLDARVSALNGQLDYKWCQGSREDNFKPAD